MKETFDKVVMITLAFGLGLGVMEASADVIGGLTIACGGCLAIAAFMVSVAERISNGKD